MRNSRQNLSFSNNSDELFIDLASESGSFQSAMQRFISSQSGNEIGICIFIGLSFALCSMQAQSIIDSFDGVGVC